MIEEWFTALTRAVDGGPLLACGAALVWGVLSILLSPCHLASLPLVVGFIGGQEQLTTRRAALIALLFSTGILLTIALIGILTAAAGRMMGDIGSVGTYGVAAIFFMVGLHLLRIIRLPLPNPSPMNMKRKGLWPAFLLGLLFGIALGPCTFAYMAPMLAVTFRLSASNLPYGLLLLLLYAVGHCAVIVLAGTFTEVIQRYLKWNERSRGVFVVRGICGVLILLAGLYLVYIA